MALVFGNGLAIGGGISISTVTVAGDQLYDTPGTYSWTAPEGVSSVCVVCVGGGGAGSRGESPSSSVQQRIGGGGGGLGWKNNIAVTPGQTYTVVVGAGGNALLGGTVIATSNTSQQIVASGNVTFTLNSPTVIYPFETLRIGSVAGAPNNMKIVVANVSGGNTVISGTVISALGAGNTYNNWEINYEDERGVPGGDSYFISQSLVAGLGGRGGARQEVAGQGGTYIGDGGGNGGYGGRAPLNPLSLDPGYLYRYSVGGGSGGSAGGYSGNGGNAGVDGDTFAVGNPRQVIMPTAGSGGAPGGSWNSTPNNFVMTPPNSTIVNYSFGAGSGGSGVGVYGEGASGGYWATFSQSYVMSGNATATNVDAGAVGESGSGGGPAIAYQNYPGVGNGFGAVGIRSAGSLQLGGNGGLYGGGGGSVGPQQELDPNDDRIGYGGNGAVRIIWGDGRSFPDNAAPPAFSYRSLLSSAGQSAYDAAGYDEWFGVSAQDYANVAGGISGASTIGWDTATMTVPSNINFSLAGNDLTGTQAKSTVPANNYVLGLSVRTMWTNNPNAPFNIYLLSSPTFRATPYGRLGKNAVTLTAASAVDDYTPRYYLRKNPSRASGLTTYVGFGEMQSGSGEQGLLGTNDATPLGATAAAYSTNNMQSWITVPFQYSPLAQWLLTTDVNW